MILTKLASPTQEAPVGLEETGDGICSLYFIDLLLAKIDERDVKLIF